MMAAKVRKHPHVRPLTADDVRRLESAMAFVRRNFGKGIELTDVAPISGWSPCHFHRLFKLWHGKTPKQAISELQIEKAKRLMLAGHSFGKVAKACGYNDGTHLSHRFHMAVGKTPAHWLRGSRWATPASRRA